MDRLDLKQTHKQLYAPSAREPALVTVPRFTCFAVDGAGDPNGSPRFEAACEALYALSYTLKFARKQSGGPEYTVPPLEGLWWAEDMAAFDLTRREAWLWTLLIVQPVGVSPAEFDALLEQVRRKKGGLPALGDARLLEWEEGLCAQVMHLGPYAAEGPTVARLHGFIADSGYEPTGKHHEIYLGDPRRTAPEKLKTVLRQPVRKAGGQAG